MEEKGGGGGGWVEGRGMEEGERDRGEGGRKGRRPAGGSEKGRMVEARKRRVSLSFHSL